MKDQNLNNQPSAPSVTQNKGSSRIEEMEYSLAHRLDSYDLRNLSMIQVATFHKYPRFCETSLQFSQCSGGQEIDSQINKELKKMCRLEITSNWNKDYKFSKFLHSNFLSYFQGNNYYRRQ